jgi:nucleotidyltransferase/DNA polymerase involved in DNA repair
MVVAPGQERAFLAPLPLRRLDGVSEPTLRVLRASGLVTIGELQRVPKAALQAEFGPQEGLHLWRTARGFDTPAANGACTAPSHASWQELLFSGWERSGASLPHSKTLGRDVALTTSR